MIRGKQPSTDDQDMRALAAQYERWASETETWARALEAQLHQTQVEADAARAELARVKRSLSWRLTAPLRTVSALAGLAGKRTVVGGAKSVARSVLERGLAVLRRHDGLRSGVRSTLRRIPWAEARLEAFVDARAEEGSDW